MTAVAAVELKAVTGHRSSGSAVTGYNQVV